MNAKYKRPIEDYHLIESEIGDRRYGYPDPDWGDKMRGARFARCEAGFTYTHDVGDDWRHCYAA
ncbi:hypothetical protein IC608_15350 [Devosia sp. PTR5]|uniref:Uncharacterized protein n=1 Tax=Devosia oryzisoli TaxID=2774138 RepID=A0A927FV30_9HYPH|nr:hypothetical protein [Devosia oryzisoli]MBD8066850.1 hypothetical protein [Devosia oryzisoli]